MLYEKVKKIKLVILDVDGTMTDGGIYVFEDGRQAKKFNAKDGLGIIRARKAGYEFGIISHSFVTGMVEARAKTIGIERLYIGRESKLEILSKWCEEMKLGMEQIAYVGDDVNDQEVMEHVGLAVCPADAVRDIRSIAHLVLTKNGGDGAVREFIDDYLLI